MPKPLACTHHPEHSREGERRLQRQDLFKLLDRAIDVVVEKVDTD